MRVIVIGRSKSPMMNSDLGEGASCIGAFCSQEHGITLVRPGDAASARSVAGFRWNEVQRIRREPGRLLEALSRGQRGSCLQRPRQLSPAAFSDCVSGSIAFTGRQ